MANSVSVYSNGFNFCLDKRCRLGIINPTLLNDVQSKVKPGWTRFVLELSVSDAEYQVVKSSLLNISPEMLLFTRRLKELEIIVASESRLRSRTDTFNRVVYAVTKQSDIYTIEQSDNTCKLNYFCHVINVSDMPYHASRPGITESNVVVAFPFTSDMTPIVDNQKIFAFMPLHPTSLFVPPLSRDLIISFLSRAIFLRKPVAKVSANKTFGI